MLCVRDRLPSEGRMDQPGHGALDLGVREEMDAARHGIDEREDDMARASRHEAEPRVTGNAVI